MRVALKWSQDRLAKETGMNQNAISRLESPEYGKATITTLKRLAAEFDVGLIVRFVPFSAVVDWVSGTPRVDRGLTSDALAIAGFVTEEEAGVFDSAPGAFSVAPFPKDFAVPEAASHTGQELGYFEEPEPVAVSLPGKSTEQFENISGMPKKPPYADVVEQPAKSRTLGWS